MRIAVVGAAGRMGSLLMKEGINRGHEMTAIVRDVYIVPDPSVRVIEGDVHDLVFNDIWDQDVILNAFGVWELGNVGQHISSLMHLADILEGKEIRLLVSGTAGNLYLDEDLTTRIIDLPDFPKGAYPIVSAMCEAYDMLRAREEVKWTYFSPAPDFKPNEERSGIYRLGGETVPRNMKGKSEIGYADMAVAMLDEAENGEHICERISVYTV